MNKGFTIFLSFSAGFGAGIALGRTFFKQKYSQLAQDEIDSVKAALKKYEPDGDKNKKADRFQTTDSSSIVDMPPEKKAKYREYTRDLGYDQGVNEQNNEAKNPYIISPDEFGSMPDYEELSFTYFAGDDVVADDDDEKMNQTDVLNSIGSDFKNHFGEYEKDSVYVRNDSLKTDYEINRDDGNYEEFVEKNPYLNL